MRKPVMRNRRPHAYLLADTLVALVLLAMVAGLMAKVVSDGRHARRQFAQQRQAIRLAEQTLTQLQLGNPPAIADEAHASPWLEQVRVDRVTPQPEGDWGPMVWVRVEATVDNRHATLEGALPAAHADRFAPAAAEEVADE